MALGLSGFSSLDCVFWANQAWSRRTVKPPVVATSVQRPLHFVPPGRTVFFFLFSFFFFFHLYCWYDTYSECCEPCSFCPVKMWSKFFVYFISFIIISYDWITVRGYSKHELSTINTLYSPRKICHITVLSHSCLLSATATFFCPYSLRGRRSKGKAKGIRARDHARGRPTRSCAPKFPLPLLTPAT